MTQKSYSIEDHALALVAAVRIHDTEKACQHCHALERAATVARYPEVARAVQALEHRMTHFPAGAPEPVNALLVLAFEVESLTRG